MSHAYTGKSLRSRASGSSPSVNAVLAHAAWWSAFGFAAAVVFGLVG